jgi:hypothetical protein
MREGMGWASPSHFSRFFWENFELWSKNCLPNFNRQVFICQTVCVRLSAKLQPFSLLKKISRVLTITPERQGIGTYSFQFSLFSLSSDYEPDPCRSVQTRPLLDDWIKNKTFSLITHIMTNT